MSLALFIYFCGIVGSLTMFFFWSGLIAVICATIVKIYTFEANQVFEPIWFKTFICGIISLFLCAFIPSEKTMYMMAGGYTVQKVVESPEVQKINDKVFKVINDKLDDYLTEDKKATAKK